MKVLIYAEAKRFIGISGIGCAVRHQESALSQNGISYTTDANDDFDVVHINTYGLASRRLAKKARSNGKAVVYHAHSTEEDFRDSFIGSNLIAKSFKKWITSCYNLGDVIVTPTEYSKQLISSYGIDKPIYSVSNGIDLSYYKGKPSDRAEFRKQFGFSEDDKVIMSVGLYIERKGILDFVEMAKRMPDYKFIWFGKTPLYTVPPKIIRAVKSKLPNLTFAGYVEPATLKKAYHGADLFMFMTHEETEGIVLLEALASRQNVLVRNIPIYMPFIDGCDLYKANNVEEFCVKARKIIEKRLPDLTENGYKAVESKAISAVGDELAKVYDIALINANTTTTSAREKAIRAAI